MTNHCPTNGSACPLGQTLYWGIRPGSMADIGDMEMVVEWLCRERWWKRRLLIAVFEMER